LKQEKVAIAEEYKEVKSQFDSELCLQVFNMR